MNWTSAAVNLGIWLVGVIFGAGITLAMVRQMRRDVNGIGKIQRRDRWNTMLARMVITEIREDRQVIADLLREP